MIVLMLPVAFPPSIPPHFPPPRRVELCVWHLVPQLLHPPVLCAESPTHQAWRGMGVGVGVCVLHPQVVFVCVLRVMRALDEMNA